MAYRLLTGLTAQQKGTTIRWYSNKTSLVTIQSKLSGNENEVFPVENDPVDAQIYPSVGLYSYYNNFTNFGLNVLLEYPNPLQPDEYPSFSSGDSYIGGELFLYFTKVCNFLICFQALCLSCVHVSKMDRE